MNPIADLRKVYKKETLLESTVSANAIDQFTKWWKDALDNKVDEANAMTLATAGDDGFPHSRIVLLKGFDKNGFVFFTNYQSHKSIQINQNSRVALLFFWRELERQVRIEGIAQKVSDAESDEYFNSRPLESRIGAWVSAQSSVIASREILEQKVKDLEKEFEGRQIERPKFWGGFCVKPLTIEFWQGRPGRLHDRIFYTLQEDNAWKISRLSP